MDLVKMYLTTNKNDYDMKDKEKETYELVLKELTFDYGDYKTPKEFKELYGN